MSNPKETQVEKSVRLMKLKCMKAHKCERDDLVFSTPQIGKKMESKMRTVKMRYRYRGRLTRWVTFDGKTIRAAQTSQELWNG